MIFLLLFLLLGAGTAVAAQSEHIQRFESTITVNPDGWLTVQEHIVLYTTSKRHGIVREFPTTDLSFKLFEYYVDFRVERILLNGQAVSYRIEKMANGKALYIGDPATILSPGIYTYTIEYKVNRLLGFFSEHDELWFNVTGNGWRLPIAHAIAHVILPTTIPADKITAECFTGDYGSQEKHCTITRQGNQIDFYTTKPLPRFHGLSVVLTWPTGFVTQPTWVDQLWYFVKDNVVFLWLLCILLLLITFYLITWFYRIKPTRVAGTIVPLFYPPASLTPAGVRYIVKQGYDSACLAAEVVNMAVKGLLTIKHMPGSWGQAKYELNKAEPALDVLPLHQELQSTLFPATKDMLMLENSYNSALEKTQRALQTYLTTHFATYFDTHEKTVVTGIAFSFISSCLLFLVDPYVYELPWFWLFFVAVGLVSALFYYSTRGYTPVGQRIYEEIQGFKLFLSTTETERLAMIGTPPTRTPELYETYLPYAMALGVEQAWSAQFAPLFEQMMHDKKPYTPHWYHGPYANRFGSSYFASTLGNGIGNAVRHATTLRHTPISSSSIRPGSRSGSGGRGFSGGGGGGGGGGTW